MRAPVVAAIPPAGPGREPGRGSRRERPRRPGFESLEERVACSVFDAPVLQRSPVSAFRPVAAVASTPYASQPAPGSLPIKRFSDLTYTNGTTAPETLDVYLPASPAPPGGWPVVMAIHGGGWQTLDKAQYGARVAPPLASSGFAVVVPNYTLATIGSPSWPAPFLELQQAVRWVRANAHAMHVDGSRIAAMGESAGAHLALMLGTAPASRQTRVQAVVDFYGPTDLATLRTQNDFARSAVDALLGSAASDPAALAKASPLRQVTSDDPPVLILHGTADPLVPPAQSVTLASALTKAHVPNTLLLIPGVRHYFGYTPNGRSLLPEILSFLTRYLRIVR